MIVALRRSRKRLSYHDIGICRPVRHRSRSSARGTRATAIGIHFPITLSVPSWYMHTGRKDTENATENALLLPNLEALLPLTDVEMPGSCSLSHSEVPIQTASPGISSLSLLEHPRHTSSYALQRLSMYQSTSRFVLCFNSWTCLHSIVILGCMLIILQLRPC